jgi:hypothetical protein
MKINSRLLFTLFALLGMFLSAIWVTPAYAQAPTPPSTCIAVTYGTGSISDTGQYQLSGALYNPGAIYYIEIVYVLLGDTDMTVHAVNNYTPPAHATGIQASNGTWLWRYNIDGEQAPPNQTWHARLLGYGSTTPFTMTLSHVCPNSQFPDSTHAPEPPFNSACQETCRQAGQPINTSTGNYNYGTTDLSIPSVGQPLHFERTYNSMQITGTAVYSRPLGYGWTHNYEFNLTFPGDPGGEPGTVILKAPHGSRLRFTEVSAARTRLTPAFGLI